MYLKTRILSVKSFSTNKINEKVINANSWKNAFGWYLHEGEEEDIAKIWIVLFF